MSPSKTPWKAGVTVLLVATINPIGGAAQQCPDGLISAIEIERLDVFELQEFEEGDCFDPFLLEESATIGRPSARQASALNAS